MENDYDIVNAIGMMWQKRRTYNLLSEYLYMYSMPEYLPAATLLFCATATTTAMEERSK